MSSAGEVAEIVQVPQIETSHHAPARGRGRHRRQPLTATGTPILELEGVTARAPGGRVLLDDVSFSVQRGWLVAVVGPTGAGKTSLARALTGALAVDRGSMRLDGVELRGPDSTRRDRIAYVPQDDVLHRQLDLRRTLAYAASLRVPKALGARERVRRVGAALHELGLEHHAHLPIASLSGGQRKRANIAAELVGEPDVIVLDEPTSGLDPGYEKAVLSNLRELADADRTVIVITHSLQVLSRCDRVLFLAEGGRVAYFGPPAGAAAYFGGTDAADVFLALDTQPGHTWKERFRSHPAYERYVSPAVSAAARVVDGATPERSPDRPQWREQVATLVRRQVALLRADRRHLALLLLQGPLLGLLLRFVLAPDSLHALNAHTVTPAAQTVAMFVALSATWLGASNAVREVVKERHILRREVDAGLAPSAYVVAKGAVLGALVLLQTSVLAAIACSAQQPRAEGALLGSGRVELIVAAALAGLAATALGLLLSSMVATPDKALAVLPMTLVTELALAGGWAASLSAPGLTLLRDLTGARWAVEAIDGTVLGDGRAFAGAIVVLVCLTLGSLVGTVALVDRQTRPARSRRPVPVRLAALGRHARSRGAAMIGAAASISLILAVGAAIGLGGDASPDVPAPLAAAEDPAEVEAPVLVVEPAPSTLTPAPVTTPPEAAAPPAPAPATVAPPPEPTTTTTVAPEPEPTTTTTFYVPPADAPTTPVAPSQVGTSSSTGSNPWAWPFQLWWEAMQLAWWWA